MARDIIDTRKAVLMGLDPNGNKGVSRAPMPTDGIECRVCRDSGVFFYDGEYRVCKGAAHGGEKLGTADLARESNETLAKLNAKTAGRRA